MTDTFDLAAMIADREAGTPGDWLYRPQKYDDWGVVRSEYDADGGYYTFICQARDPRFWGDECLNDHRKNKTDPWMANARRIARVPALEAEILRLREGLEAIRQYGSDTLDGPTEGTPDDREWQRHGVLEMTDRADRVLNGEPWKKEAISHD